MNNNNNPYGSKTHLGGIDFETVRQFIQCDINLRNGVNISDGYTLTQSERDFLTKRGMDPYNIDNISEYVRLRSIALFDINQRKKPVEEVVPEIKRTENAVIDGYSVINDRLNNSWLLQGAIAQPLLEVFTPVSYGRYMNRHAKVMEILTASEYKLLVSGDPLSFDSETMNKYFSIMRKLIKSGIYNDSKDVNKNISDKNTEETKSVKTENVNDSFPKDGFGAIMNDDDIHIYAVTEKIDTIFGKMETDRYVLKAYDNNGNEVPDYPFLPQSRIIRQDMDKGVVFTDDGRSFPIREEDDTNETV